MPDRITAIVMVPRDESLPLDVQGVFLRDRALAEMEKIAEVDKSSLRFSSASETANISLDDDRTVCTWQMNLIAALFHADGKVSKDVVGKQVTEDRATRYFSSVSFVRDNA
ncbi:hypothetical protein PBI_HOMINES_40 [Mycobacterium phage Homines]|uniref:hypothetical protein n=1 Tax=Mycobacterium phage Wheeler TaxID=1383054 RepID=UPI000387F6E9|nr:hypothetical protein WHEELER_48 [Mycobacterium phage Wheeler]AGT13907.1 hypothetical protein WHEELER_48 [Mycobacterium phage Wheeler]AXN53027.1 hypothetical protein PBI_HOMINES_40 [Mycobacterium phage Homines]